MPTIKFTGMKDGKVDHYPEEATYIDIQAQGDALHEALRSYSDVGSNARDNHVRWYCKLHKPVLNTAISHRINTLLGIPKSDMDLITKFTHVYDKTRDEIIPAAVAIEEGNTNIAVGGEYLMYCIERANPFEAIYPKLREELSKAIKECVLSTVDYTIESTYSMRGNFCYGVNITLSNVTAEQEKKIFTAFGKRIAPEVVIRDALYLNSLGKKEMVSKLKSFMLDCVLLPPVNMRPEFMKASDPMENMFVELYLANANLAACGLTPKSVERYIALYRTLWNKVHAYVHEGPFYHTR